MRRSLPVAALLLLPLSGIGAQTSSEQTPYRTRRYLDSLATDLEKGGKAEAAMAIRDRLKVGDFYPGERLVIELFGGEEPFRDTVSIRSGQEIVVGTYPAFNLRGVLRSEADSALAAQARRYLQRPVVRTYPQLRLLVSGAVGRPGFVTVRGDAAVSDVVTVAGGLTPTSRLAKSKVRRGNGILVEPDSLNTIFRSGMTLDQADIRAGDELVIDEKRPSNFSSTIWTVSTALGLILTVISLKGRF